MTDLDDPDQVKHFLLYLVCCTPSSPPLQFNAHVSVTQPADSGLVRYTFFSLFTITLLLVLILILLLIRAFTQFSSSAVCHRSVLLWYARPLLLPLPYNYNIQEKGPEELTYLCAVLYCTVSVYWTGVWSAILNVPLFFLSCPQLLHLLFDWCAVLWLSFSFPSCFPKLKHLEVLRQTLRWVLILVLVAVH